MVSCIRPHPNAIHGLLADPRQVGIASPRIWSRQASILFVDAALAQLADAVRGLNALEFRNHEFASCSPEPFDPQIIIEQPANGLDQRIDVTLGNQQSSLLVANQP
jgi:hypothetical protein